MNVLRLEKLHTAIKPLAVLGIIFSLFGIVVAVDLTGNLFIVRNDGYLLWCVIVLVTLEFLFFVYTLFPASAVKTNKHVKALVFAFSLLCSVAALVLIGIVVNVFNVHAAVCIPFLLSLVSAFAVTVLSYLYFIERKKLDKKNKK